MCRQVIHLACLGFQVRGRCDNSAAGMPVEEHRMQHPLLPIDARPPSRRAALQHRRNPLTSNKV